MTQICIIGVPYFYIYASLLPPQPAYPQVIARQRQGCTHPWRPENTGCAWPFRPKCQHAGHEPTDGHLLPNRPYTPLPIPAEGPAQSGQRHQQQQEQDIHPAGHMQPVPEARPARDGVTIFRLLRSPPPRARPPDDHPRQQHEHKEQRTDPPPAACPNRYPRPPDGCPATSGAA